MAAPIKDQLGQARQRAGLIRSELGRRLGWADHSNVQRIEEGRSTSTASMMKWAEACDHEVLIVPTGSVDSLDARFNEADERERAIAIALLDLLRDARAEMPGVLDYFEDDVGSWRSKLERRRALDAG